MALFIPSGRVAGTGGLSHGGSVYFLMAVPGRPNDPASEGSPTAAQPTATRSPSGASSLELRCHACEINVDCQCSTCFALVLAIHFHHSHNRTTNTFDTVEENLGNILYGPPCIRFVSTR